jgi:hypothetical protein
MHVSELFEHAERDRYVGSGRRCDLAVSLADQFFDFISEQFAKIVRNPNVLSVIVNKCGVYGRNARS